VFLQLLAAAGLVISLAALIRAVSLHRRLTALNQHYWELRYDFGKLRARLAKIDGGPSGSEQDEATVAPER
jgi:hypothetical protein